LNKNIFVRKSHDVRESGQSGPATFFLATLASVSTSEGVTIIPDGQATAIPKKYKCLTGAGMLTAGDRVVVMKHSGTCVVLGKIGIPGSDGDDKVSKSGDTMTGGLVMDNSNVSIRDPVIRLGTRPAANHWTMQFRILDSIGEAIAWIRAVAGANGQTGIQLYGRNIVSGTGKNNYLGLYMSDAGAATVDINQPAAWRKALGLGSTSGALPITVAQGGTGAATAAAKTVFAGPSSGSPAAPSFRPLTSADLPPISLDNFTGILPVDNGGTGATAVTTTSVVSEIATAASGFTITAANYSVWGKVATIRVFVRATAAVTGTGWNTVATIASGKRPTIYFALSNPDLRKMQITGSSGTLQVYGAIAKDEEFNFVATYLLA